MDFGREAHLCAWQVLLPRVSVLEVGTLEDPDGGSIPRKWGPEVGTMEDPDEGNALSACSWSNQNCIISTPECGKVITELEILLYFWK